MGLTSYLRDTRAELRHVSWPTRKQAIQYTILVVVISLLVAALLGAFDFVYNYLLENFVIGESKSGLPGLDFETEQVTNNGTTASPAVDDVENIEGLELDFSPEAE